MWSDKPTYSTCKDLDGWNLFRGALLQGRFPAASGWTAKLVEEMVEVLNGTYIHEYS